MAVLIRYIQSTRLSCPVLRSACAARLCDPGVDSVHATECCARAQSRYRSCPVDAPKVPQRARSGQLAWVDGGCWTDGEAEKHAGK